MQSYLGKITDSQGRPGGRSRHGRAGFFGQPRTGSAAGLPVILYDGTDNYINALGLIGRVDAANSQLWYPSAPLRAGLPDGLGSTADVRDGNGNAVASYTYDVFGVPTQTGSSNNYFEFAGEQLDSESGYDCLRARYYDPVVGRLLGEDPQDLIS